MGRYDRYYIGSKFDWWVVSDGGSTTAGYVLCGLDLPFSFVFDTVLLPLDFTMTQLDSREK